MSTTNTRRAILFSQYDWLTGVDIARTSSTSKNATHDCFGAVSRRTGTSVATDRRVRTETPIAEYAAHPTQRLETTTDSVYSVERTQTRTQSAIRLPIAVRSSINSALCLDHKQREEIH
ncbi:hypothetical protein ACFQL7_15590 [Halocatena marina]|uniref:Uncharacterized protein n=1 Tax=Halocatena marina TaxID=2934937 RepID=A0ABD5YPH8_9EURY